MWQIIFRGDPPWSVERSWPRFVPQVGDAWWYTTERDFGLYREGFMKSMSRRFVPTRRPIVIKFPCYEHCIDLPWMNSADLDGWQITISGVIEVGRPVLISMTPSVGLGVGFSDYHGWVGTNGVPVGWIGDNLGGKTHEA